MKGQTETEIIKVLNHVCVSGDSSRVPVLLDLSAAFNTQPEHKKLLDRLENGVSFWQHMKLVQSS